MKAEEYLKQNRIYDDETIYNAVGDIVGTLSQLMNDYHECEVKNLDIPLVSESLPIRYCQQCGEPLRRNKHKTWCEHYSGNVR